MCDFPGLSRSLQPIHPVPMETKHAIFITSKALALSLLFVVVLIGVYNRSVRVHAISAMYEMQRQHNEGFTFGMPSIGEESSFHDNVGTTNQPHFLSRYVRTLEESDIVELDHCSIDDLDWPNFTSLSRDVMERVYFSNKKFDILRIEQPSKAKKVEMEWTMELLEMFATHRSLCNFDNYRFKIRGVSDSIRHAGMKLTNTLQNVKTPPLQSRIAIVIVAFQDSKQLERLVDAVILPQHLIVIHLDNDTSPTFLEEVTTIASRYPNVAILQFGKIVYETDSVSRINLQVMDFLVNSLHLEYDHHVTLDGAAFPLLGATELAQHLHSSNGNVWMGEMTHKGQAVHHQQYMLLWKKRLHSTIGPEKLETRAGVLFRDDAVPEWLDKAMHHKSTSGNQAVFRFATVQQLISNRQVKQMFAIAKYGCCCCIEERTWIAAMDILGLLEEAKRSRGMYQLWGGFTECRGSMKNAVLEMNQTTCYRSENARGNNGDLYIHGSSLWESLKEAKQQGALFARKFHSDNVGSMQLLNKIVHEMHG